MASILFLRLLFLSLCFRLCVSASACKPTTVTKTATLTKTVNATKTSTATVVSTAIVVSTATAILTSTETSTLMLTSTLTSTLTLTPTVPLTLPSTTILTPTTSSTKTSISSPTTTSTVTSTLGSTTTSNLTGTSTSTSIPSATVLPPFSGKNLRILPIGDSITFGLGGLDGNGYRFKLEQALQATGNNVQMLGNVQSGSSTVDPFCAGYVGQYIATIQNRSQPTLPWRPNVVLLHAGTNDVKGNSTDAVTPLSILLDNLIQQLPDATILVAQIVGSPLMLQNGTTTGQSIQDFNRGVAALVADRAIQGSKVLLVDMFNTPALNNKTCWFDTVHPNANGYNFMVNVWNQGLRLAAANGMLQNPVPLSSLQILPMNRRKACFNGGPTWTSQGQIFDGANLGPSVVAGTNCTTNAQNANSCDCTYPDGTNATVARATGGDCAAMSNPTFRTIQFADVDNDGLDDLIWVGPNGTASVYLNTGSAFSFLTAIALPVGAQRDQVQFADINGDGRADMLWIQPSGQVQGWYNTGSSSGISWIPLGVIYNSSGLPGAGIRFWDINGDSISDFCYVDNSGRVTLAYGLGNNAWGASILLFNSIVGPRDQVVMGDTDGNGWADYISINRTTGATQRRNAAVLDNGAVIWSSLGNFFSGLVTNGTGLQFADFNGDGRADVVNVDPDTSAVTAWLNACPPRPAYGKRSLASLSRRFLHNTGVWEADVPF